MVSQLIKPESHYQSAFRRLHADGKSRQPGWFERLRQSAMDSFERLGFPTVKQEEWKYTNLARLAKLDFDPFLISATKLAADTLQPFSYPESVNSQLVMVNGVLRSDYSSISATDQIVAMELAEAVVHDRYGELVREHLARGADFSASGLTALNTAFLTSGAFVLIPRNVKLDVPLHILCLSDPVGTGMATFPRVLIVSEENSSATIIETYASTRESQYFTNGVVEIVLKDESRLEHYRLQRESVDAFHVATTTADLGRGSSYNTTSITLGAELSRHDINVVLDHEGAECRVDGLYIVSTGQHADTHSLIDHRQSHCTSRQLYKGILDGNSRAVFNGKVFVHHGAQKTDAMQTNKNLLLSPEAHVDTKPQLEIFADDVKCAHGAAVGQIDQEELFYLKTRGIHPDLGRNLLTYGFAEEVIGKIEVDSIRLQLDEAVLHRLNTRLEA
jgi:Fe-S cluster assembly protein SufD